MEALWLSDSKGLARFECFQPQYSLVVRDIEQELIPVCELKGLGVVVWSPLGGGFLSGKYKPGERTVEGTRSADSWAYPQRYFADNADDSLQAVFDVAEEIGRSPAQVALRWVLEQPAITSIIIGARTIEQARDNLLAGSFRLEGEALTKLNDISYLPHRYPEEMEKNMHQRRDDAVEMPSLE
jgi:aryl-alcohol dehydrogenase-like predicted oxidoreductase